ncbi:DUF1761 domain-containing protein [Frigidibacter sp. RF13]|uniref:DUF1761 domain-containing protein n=1 Tax=Frigidibacter sp. RF13 TaxID=2997340 RepID=UPI00226E00DD|nr:DUF1761 domain-containing protein [Frigidibacter sp. RF13]MCY1127363.1 DUF1761 domain-containing protein [Frigidibacter sp. RF13]
METGINWPAVLLGTAAAFALGMVWFGPLFGRIWAAGSHNISPPARPPVAAMLAQLAGTFFLAFVVGLTAVRNDLWTALAAILAVGVLQFAGRLFSQKTMGAALVDGTYPLAMGALMIAAQGIL